MENYVYRSIDEDGEPSSDYLKNGNEIAEKQMVKAGYRLAHVLREIWKERQDIKLYMDEELGKSIEEALPVFLK